MNADTPAIDIVIPAHGRSTLVERAAQSALLQKSVQTRVIIVDDGSYPPLAETLPAAILNQCFILQRLPRAGAGHARNVGIMQTHSHWIAFLDADDSWLPQHLITAIQCAERYSADAVVGAYLATFQDKSILYCSQRPSGLINDFASYMFLQGGLSRTSTFICTNPLARHILFESGYQHQDWDFMLRASEDYKIAYNACPTVYVDHTADDRYSRNRDASDSLHFLERHCTHLTLAQRNGFRIRVATSAAARSQPKVVKSMLRDLEPPVPLIYRLKGVFAQLLANSPMLTRAARRTYVFWKGKGSRHDNTTSESTS